MEKKKRKLEELEILTEDIEKNNKKKSSGKNREIKGRNDFV